MNCSRCGSALNAGAQFCRHCGAPVGGARAQGRIGTNRILRVFRDDANIYLVESGIKMASAPAMCFAIQAPRHLPEAQFKKLRALARLQNMLTIQRQARDARGNPFLIVDYVDGTPLDDLPAPVDVERAFKLALQLTQIVGYLNENELTCTWQTTGSQPTDSLKRFQRSFIADATGKLFLYDYTALAPMPREKSKQVNCIRGDVVLITRTLVWLLSGNSVGRFIGGLKADYAQFTNLVAGLIKDPPADTRKLAATLTETQTRQPQPGKTIPLGTWSSRQADAGKTSRLTFALVSANLSDKGRQRDHNEDSWLDLRMDASSGIFVVADGMGGHAAGEVASQMAVEEIRRNANAEWTQLQQLPTADNVRSYLHAWSKSANAKIFAAAQARQNNMGSTFTAALALNRQVYAANVGDSRTYLFRGGELYPLTRDHSLVASLVLAGLLDADAVYDHPQRNEIFRALGQQSDVNVDVFDPVDLAPEDRLLLCCDGLWEMVRPPQLKEILARHVEPSAACAELVRAANVNGGEDNITVVVVRVMF